MFSCCILWSLRWYFIFKLYRIYVKVNECIIFEIDYECFEYVIIGVKLCVFYVLLCFVIICLKYKKKIWSVGFFFLNIILIWLEVNVMIDFEILIFF